MLNLNINYIEDPTEEETDDEEISPIGSIEEITPTFNEDLIPVREEEPTNDESNDTDGVLEIEDSGID